MSLRAIALLPIAALTALLFAAAPAAAADKLQGQFRQFKAGEPLQLRADRAYLLLRIDTSYSKFTANMLRVPVPAELAAYDEAKRAAYAKAGGKSENRAVPIERFGFDYQGPPNFFELSPSQPLAMEGKLAIVLAEVMPGDYVFYGEGYRGYLFECFCLGTVGFTAAAGQVVDMGTMLIAKASAPSPIPELTGEVDLGPSASMDYQLFAVALRPQRTGDTLPPGLDAARVSAARFRAVGPFVEPNAMLINRLAPIPGVLAYDRGRVIDVATGLEAPAN
jgi:hypothetical protein